jgi:hypothetical protein
VPSLCATSLLQEGCEVRGLPLAARPKLHALVKDWNAGMVGAGSEGCINAVALKQDRLRPPVLGNVHGCFKIDSISHRRPDFLYSQHLKSGPWSDFGLNSCPNVKWSGFRMALDRFVYMNIYIYI